MMKNVNGSGDVKLTQNNNTLLPSQWRVSSPARGKTHQWALSSRYQQVVSHQAFRFRSPWRETAPPRRASLSSLRASLSREISTSHVGEPPEQVGQNYKPSCIRMQRTCKTAIVSLISNKQAYIHQARVLPDWSTAQGNSVRRWISDLFLVVEMVSLNFLR